MARASRWLWDLEDSAHRLWAATALAREAGPGLSPTCQRSRAWLQGLFEDALESSALVEMTQTVIGGAPVCHWTVRLG